VIGEMTGNDRDIPVEVRTSLVGLAGTKSMALCATSLEETSTLASVT
jgi:hypothetical protein